MINFEILEDPFRVHLSFNSENLNYPLDVHFINQYGTAWQTKVESSGYWVTGPLNVKDLSVRILDGKGDVVFSYDPIFSSLSDEVEKKFIDWCRDFIAREGHKPKGFIVGSHDGRSGEWVQAYSQDLIGDCLIIEPNINPFLLLTYIYRDNKKFTFKNCLVSEHDGFADFYTNESGDSEASSMIESNCLKHPNIGFKKIKVRSYNPNTLLQDNIPDFIHIDAEGYDGNIILMLGDEILNNVKFIIWEHIHLTEETNKMVNEKLVSCGFVIEQGQGYNTCAYKNINHSFSK